MEYINNYINENKDRFINELIELLKIPSISADPTYKADVLNCAEAVAKAMEDAFQVWDVDFPLDRRLLVLEFPSISALI